MSQLLADQLRSPIRPLNTHLANQIAAGEVVERPASIVKELLENSIDAGATQITLTLEEGGLKSINVLDNGWGIPAEELALALMPHATSKIYKVEDLVAITSMGFRGEALASIASVSRLRLISRTDDSDSGWQIYARHSEQNPQAKPAAHPTGTTINVEELFFNTPARRRFLRSARTEFRHCEDVVRRLALSHFSIAFKLIHNGKTIFNFSAAQSEAAIRLRLQKFGGKRFTEEAVPLSYEASGLRLHGWVGPPSLARSQSDLQFFFVNGRIIRDRLVSHALRQAYGERVFPGRYPAYVLFLNVDHKEIDINVHPTKHEVRFHQARLVHDFLSSGIRHALEHVSQHHGLLSGDTPKQVPARDPVNREELAWHKSAPPNVPEPISPSYIQRAHLNLAENKINYSEPEFKPDSAQADQIDLDKNRVATIPLLYERYGLFKHDTAWGLIDLNQYWYHSIKQTLIGNVQTPEMKPLLFPQRFSVDEKHIAALNLMRPAFTELGLDLKPYNLEDTGPHQFVLHQLPAILQGLAIHEFISEMFRLQTSEKISPSEIRDSILNLAASHMTKMTLSNGDDINLYLISLRQQYPDDLFWQHPAIQRITEERLQKMFTEE